MAISHFGGVARTPNRRVRRKPDDIPTKNHVKGNLEISNRSWWPKICRKRASLGQTVGVFAFFVLGLGVSILPGIFLLISCVVVHFKWLIKENIKHSSMTPSDSSWFWACHGVYFHGCNKMETSKKPRNPQRGELHLNSRWSTPWVENSAPVIGLNFLKGNLHCANFETPKNQSFFA